MSEGALESQRGFSLPWVPLGGPGGRGWGSGSRSDKAEVSGSRAEGGGSQPHAYPADPPCSGPQPGSSPPLPSTGRNVSRSCTDEGWAHLEPGPYDVACTWDDKEWSLEEVGRRAPQRPPECRAPPTLSRHGWGQGAIRVEARVSGVFPPPAFSHSRPEFPGTRPLAPPDVRVRSRAWLIPAKAEPLPPARPPHCLAGTLLQPRAVTRQADTVFPVTCRGETEGQVLEETSLGCPAVSWGQGQHRQSQSQGRGLPPSR